MKMNYSASNSVYVCECFVCVFLCVCVCVSVCDASIREVLTVYRP